MSDKETFLGKFSFSTQMLKITKHSEGSGKESSQNIFKITKSLHTLYKLFKHSPCCFYSAHFPQPGYWKRGEMWPDAVQLSGLHASVLQHPCWWDAKGLIHCWSKTFHWVKNEYNFHECMDAYKWRLASLHWEAWTPPEHSLMSPWRFKAPLLPCQRGRGKTGAASISLQNVGSQSFQKFTTVSTKS